MKFIHKISLVLFISASKETFLLKNSSGHLILLVNPYLPLSFEYMTYTVQYIFKCGSIYNIFYIFNIFYAQCEISIFHVEENQGSHP